MARSTTTQTPCLLVWCLVAALISQNLLLPVSSSTFQDQKNFFYFPPVDPGVGSPPIDPGVGSPPIDPGVGSPPVIQSPPIVPSPPFVSSPPIVPSPPTGSYTYPPPTHGSGGTPPVHHHPPSHGGGGGSHHHGKSPPANCGNPTPPKHVDPSPPHHHNPSPAPPTGGYHYNNPPPKHADPSPPTGEYHYSPPPSGGYTPTPTVPSLSPPVVLPPITPGSPLIPAPTDPNTPPIGGTCDFWRNHPGIIWGLFGWWGTTMGTAFGTPSLPGTGSQLNLLQALSNTRTDGLGALYREGTASLLNSMVNKNFPYTTSHVKDSFLAAVGSNKAAAAQARVFKLANEGHMKLRV